MQDTRVRFGFIDLLTLMAANILAWSCMNIYIPCLPAVAADFGISEFAVKMTVVANIIGGIIGRIFWGPLSDNYGRKSLFLHAFNLSLIGIMGCYFSTYFHWFMLFRIIQGMGTGVISVVTMSIISDVYTGVKRANLIGTVEMCWPIAWGIAPIFGAYCGSHYTWRISLLGLFIILLLLRTVVQYRLQETVAFCKNCFSLRGMCQEYSSLTKNKLFLIYALIPGFVLSGYMVFAINSPFVYVEQFGYDATQFAVLQSIPLLVYFLTTFFYRFVIKNFGFNNACKFGIYVHVIFACFMLSVTVGFITASPFIITLFTCIQCLANGFLIPAGSTIALKHAPRDSLGMASSVISLGRNLIVSSCFFISGLFELSATTLCAMIFMTVIIVLSLFGIAKILDYPNTALSMKNASNDDAMSDQVVHVGRSNIE